MLIQSANGCSGGIFMVGIREASGGSVAHVARPTGIHPVLARIASRTNKKPFGHGFTRRAC